MEERFTSKEILSEPFPPLTDESTNQIPRKVIQRNNKVSDTMIKIITNMKRNGYKPKEIAVLTDLTKSTVLNVLRQVVDDRPLMDSTLSKRGRKKSENINLKRRINNFLVDDDTITLKSMREKLKESGFDISVSYLSKTMKKMGIRKKTVSQQLINIRKSTDESSPEISEDDPFLDDNIDSLPPPVHKN